MQWDWDVVVSALGGLVVGAGVVWLAGHSARRQVAGRLREERHRHRFAEAYVELLTTLEKLGQWAQLVRPVLDFGIEAPPLPGLAEQARVQALLAAYGSPQVVDLYHAHHKTIAEILKLDQLIASVVERGEEVGVGRSDLWERLDTKLRPDEAAARKALALRVAVELNR